MIQSKDKTLWYCSTSITKGPKHLKTWELVGLPLQLHTHTHTHTHAHTHAHTQSMHMYFNKYKFNFVYNKIPENEMYMLLITF